MSEDTNSTKIAVLEERITRNAEHHKEILALHMQCQREAVEKASIELHEQMSNKFMTRGDSDKRHAAMEAKIANWEGRLSTIVALATFIGSIVGSAAVYFAK